MAKKPIKPLKPIQVIGLEDDIYTLAAGKTVAVTGPTAGIGLNIDNVDDATVKLLGTITTKDAATHIGLRLNGIDSTIITGNKSMIDSSGDGILVSGESDFTTLKLSGTIKAAEDAIQIDGGTGFRPERDSVIKLTKSSVVESVKTGILIGDILVGDGVLIKNAGTIKAATAIQAGSTDIDLVNTGTITGDIRTGSGDDHFDFTQGTFTGKVDAGGGYNTFVLKDATGLSSITALTASALGSYGEDTIIANFTISLGTAGTDKNIENVTLTGTAALDATGNELGNELTGNAADNKLDGGKGGDYLYGGAGKDTLTGGEGDDTLYGEDGDDTLDGGTGYDNLYGGLGNDTLTGGTGYDYLYGGAGNDTLDAGTEGGSLYGDDGDDILKGGDGGDALRGGKGTDTLTGGAGSDNFYLILGSGADTVTDFKDGEDRIIVSDLNLTGATNVEKFNLFKNQITQVSPNEVKIDFGAGDTLTLKSETPLAVADLTIADFLF